MSKPVSNYCCALAEQFHHIRCDMKSGMNSNSGFFSEISKKPLSYIKLGSLPFFRNLISLSLSISEPYLVFFKVRKNESPNIPKTLLGILQFLHLFGDNLFCSSIFQIFISKPVSSLSLSLA